MMTHRDIGAHVRSVGYEFLCLADDINSGAPISDVLAHAREMIREIDRLLASYTGTDAPAWLALHGVRLQMGEAVRSLTIMTMRTLT